MSESIPPRWGYWDIVPRAKPRGTYTYKTLVSASLGVQVKMKFPSERGARRAGWDLINAYFYERTYLQLQCLSHPVTLRVPPLSEGNEPLTPSSPSWSTIGFIMNVRIYSAPTGLL